LKINLSFDSLKNERNILIRGLDFNLVGDFDWSTALINEDVRKDYGENRYVAIAFIRENLRCQFLAKSKLYSGH